MVLVFAVLLYIAQLAGLLGIALGGIIISWFFKYAYILFDHTVRGFDEPPTLDIQMVNPWDEQRPLAQMFLFGLLAGAVFWVYYELSAAAGIALAALCLLVIPASVAVLGLERNAFKAVYPPALARVILGLGSLYPAVFGVVAAYALLLALTARMHLWLPVEIACGMFAILSVFSGLGGALYERRHELGLETWHSPERTAEVKRRAELRHSEREVTAAYGKMRAGSHVAAWAALQAWLHSRGHAVEDYRWLCDKVGSWNDARYPNRLTEEYVERLWVLKRTGEALDAVARRVKTDPGFRPKTAATTLGLAQLAARGGGAAALARLLLGDFAARFPGDPRLATASALARELNPARTAAARPPP